MKTKWKRNQGKRHFKACTCPSNIELILLTLRLLSKASERNAELRDGKRQEAIMEKMETEISIITFCKCVKILCKNEDLSWPMQHAHTIAEIFY